MGFPHDCCCLFTSCVQLCDSMDCSTPGVPALRCLLEPAQTRVHQGGDAIQPSHSVIPFFSCPQSFPASGSFPMSQFFLLQVTKVLEIQLLSVLPMNIQGWSPLGLIGLMSLQSKGLSKIFSNTTVQKHQFFSAQPSLWSKSHIHKWLLEKNIAFTTQTFVVNVISLFNTLSRSVMAFLPRCKRRLISWLQSPSTVHIHHPQSTSTIHKTTILLILESKKIKSVTVSIVLPIYLPWSDDQMPWFSFFECRVLSQLFHSPLSPSSRGSSVPLCFLP